MSQETVGRTWVQTAFQPLIVATMMACLAMSVVQLLQLLVPTWNGTYLTVVVFLAALEATAANRLVRRYRLRGGALLRFRAGEWVLILMVLKLGSYVTRGIDALVDDVMLWQKDIIYLITVEYVIAIFLTLFTWVMATDIEHALTELAVPLARTRVNRGELQSQLVTQFFWGGVILLMAAGVTRVGVAAILDMAHPPVPGIILNALLYFVLGLVLLSQARLTVLKVRWQLQDTPADADLGSRWSRVSLVFIFLVAVVALLLPTSYSYGLLESIGLILGFILQVVNFAIGLLLMLLTLPFALLLSLLPGGGTPVSPPDSRPPPPILPPDTAGHSLWAVLRSLLFWGLVIGIVVYTLRSYIGYREDLLSELRAHPWMHRLWALLVGLWQQLRGVATDAMEPIRRRLASAVPDQISAGGRRLWRWRSLSSMSPRERIQYYYLSIVHRGEKAGRPRRAGETPYEYSTSLRRQTPDVELDLNELTEAFVEARYSRHEVTGEQAERLRQVWHRLKRAFRAKIYDTTDTEF